MRCLDKVSPSRPQNYVTVKSGLETKRQSAPPMTVKSFAKRILGNIAQQRPGGAARKGAGTRYPDMRTTRHANDMDDLKDDRWSRLAWLTWDQIDKQEKGRYPQRYFMYFCYVCFLDWCIGHHVRGMFGYDPEGRGTYFSWARQVWMDLWIKDVRWDQYGQTVDSVLERDHRRGPVARGAFIGQQSIQGEGQYVKITDRDPHTAKEISDSKRAGGDFLHDEHSLPSSCQDPDWEQFEAAKRVREDHQRRRRNPRPWEDKEVLNAWEQQGECKSFSVPLV